MKKYAILCAVCFGTIMSGYLGSCVNIALPNIMSALNFNLDSVVWVSLAYMLPYGAVMPLTGKLGGQLGPKKVYVAGFTLFTVTSILCGLATSSTAMLIFRAIQGVGAGMILPNALTIVSETFDANERGQAVGIWGAIAAAGMAVGPPIGGYIIQIADWHMIFFSIVPLSVVGIVFAMAIIPSTKRSSTAVIDYIGAVLLGISICCLLVALNQGQKEGWDSLYIVSLFYGSFAAFSLFIAVEYMVKQPVVDLQVFRNLNFSLTISVVFTVVFCLQAVNFLMPFFLKNLLDYSSVTAGIMMLPLTVALMTVAPIAGRLADRFGTRLPVFSGVMVMTWALYSFYTIDADYSKFDFGIRLALFGVGFGLAQPPLTNSAMSSLPQDKAGVASGIYNLVQVIGGSVGVVCAETLLTRREIYHTAEMAAYLNPATNAYQEIFKLIQTLWGKQGLDSSQAAIAAHCWNTGQMLLPQQYQALKAILSGMVSRQAAIFSFQDVFYAMALFGFVSGLLALLIRQKTKVPNGTDSI